MENYENEQLNIVEESPEEEINTEPVTRQEQQECCTEPQPVIIEENGKTPAYGLAVASLILSLVSFVPFLFCLQPVVAVLAIIFGAIARSKGNRSGMSLAGIILGGIALALYVVQGYMVMEIFKNMRFRFDDFDDFGMYDF